MDRPDTRHLDTAIAILGGAGGTKRAKRKAQVELHLYLDEETYRYILSSNGRVVEEGYVHDCHPSTPHGRMNARAEAVRRLGKTVSTSLTVVKNRS